MRFNSILLTNTWAKEEISREIQNHFELNKNKNTTYQSLWNETKLVLNEKMTVLNAQDRQERSKINNLSFCLEKLEKEKIKSKVSRI